MRIGHAVRVHSGPLAHGGHGSQIGASASRVLRAAHISIE
jgi:hypothetical protein